MKAPPVVSLVALLVTASLASGAAATGASGSSSLPASGKTAGAPTFEQLVKRAGDARAAGRVDEALRHYGKALGLKPGWIEGHWAVATLLFELDRCAEAREHFRRVVAAQRQDGLAWAMTGLCDARLKDYDVALADLQQARGFGIKDPKVVSIAMFQTALLLNHAGNPEAAFEVLREFATQGKDNPAVIVAFGLSMLRLRYMPEEVPAEKREMVQLAGRGGYHLARGRRTAIGRLALEELVSRYPSEPNVHYAFGAYIAPEEPEAAIEEFRKELRTSPEHYPAMIQIASLETRRGNAKEAVPIAEQAVKIAPEAPAGRLVLGRALLETGEPVRAIQELEKGASLAPQTADIQFSLARAYQRAGRTEDAERARQEFLRLDQAAREQAGSDPGGNKEPETPGGGSDEHGGSK
jgi:tetratricopeptide (TPR) repeat protein